MDTTKEQLLGMGLLTPMLDIIFIALVLIFFVLAFWYVTFCERV
jgi:hypothetical protein